jgi:hypothetical protein
LRKLLDKAQNCALSLQPGKLIADAKMSAGAKSEMGIIQPRQSQQRWVFELLRVPVSRIPA